MSQTLYKDREKIRRTGVIIRGNANRIIGDNNVVYGHKNKFIGNNNRFYGNYNVGKGNFNVLQGIGNRALGKSNKVGDAAIMVNRKRARGERDNDNDDDDDGDDKEKEEDDEDSNSNGDNDEIKEEEITIVMPPTVDVAANARVTLRDAPRPVRRRRRNDTTGDTPDDTLTGGRVVDTVTSELSFHQVMDIVQKVAMGRGDRIPVSQLQACARVQVLPRHVRESFEQLARERQGGTSVISVVGDNTPIAMAGNVVMTSGSTGTGQTHTRTVMRVPPQDKERVDKEVPDDETNADEKTCLACLTNYRKTTGVPDDNEDKECGHHAYCVTCARMAYSGKKLGSRDARCPVCRAQLCRVILSF